MARVVWPFKPLVPMIEELEWYTDVLRARSSEQRIAVRVSPRRTFNFDHHLTDYECAAAIALVRSNQAADGFYVPDWPQLTNIGPVASGSNVILTDELPYTDIGYNALLWESNNRYERITLDASDSDGVTAVSVINSYTEARLIPLWEADADNGLANDRSAGGVNRSAITFKITENSDLGYSSYAQYRGNDIMTDCPIVGGASFAESITWPLSTIDNASGLINYLRQRSIPDMSFNMRWHQVGREVLWSLRRWLHSRRGKQKAFWLSSKGRDFEPASAISGTTITVYSDIAIRGAIFDIDIATVLGASHYRRVSSISAGSPVGGRATSNLTISSSLTVSLSDIRRISLLRCCRLDSDRVEIEYIGAGNAVVAVPCIETPEP